MRIGMLLDKPFPPDPRVANEARSLIGAGHEVFLFCLHPDGPAEEETWQGIQVRRYPMSRRFWKKASALVLTVGLYNRWFRKRLPAFIQDHRLEALHIHDLPLVGEGLRAARAADIPLIADLHENYPAAVRLYAWARSFAGRLLVRPRQWDRYEQRVVPQADRVIVVIDEARDRLPALGVDPERVTVVENTVEVNEFENFPRDEALIASLQESFTITYLGHFDRHRGLETVLDAAAILCDEMPALRVLMVGTGATHGSLESRAARLGIADRVRFEGWQPFERFPSYVRGSTVCLIPHVKTAHTDTTIPHKLFHYMLLERPVVATNCAPIERIVREARCGEIYPSGNAEALAHTLRRLQDEDLRGRMGAAGRAAVLGGYHWERSARKLVALYRDLSSS